MKPVLLVLLVCFSAATGLAQPRSRAAADPPAHTSDIRQLQQEIIELAERIKRLEAAIAKLTEAPVTQPAAGQAPAQRPNPKADAIAIGLRRKKLVIGMTMDDVERVTGHHGVLVREDRSIARYQWSLPRSQMVIEDGPKGDQGSYTLIADFEGDELVGYRHFVN